MERARYILGTLWLMAGPVLGQGTNQPPATAPLPDMGFSVLRVFGSLALVVGLFLGGVWCYKNWQRLAIQRGRAPQLKILEIKPLGGRHALYLVAYEQQRMLLASSPSGVGLITHLPDGRDGEVLPPASSFAQTLQRAVTPAS